MILRSLPFFEAALDPIFYSESLAAVSYLTTMRSDNFISVQRSELKCSDMGTNR
jgi:hypothetical protein